MILLTDIGKSHGTRAVLTGITARFPRQSLTSIIGPNGAGKSTLLMLIARLAEPGSGRITLGGADIARISRAEYARRVATLRQFPAIELRLTVEELVAFGRFPHNRGRPTAEDRRATDEAIAFLSLDTIRKARLDELSGGQRQMAFLAMTIAQQTDCLLLDEPLNNLDMRHALRIMQALRSLCDDLGRTVVAVIHDINFAANHSDQIIALKDGRLHSSGTVDQVVTEAGLRDLYGLDFHILPRPHGRLCDYFTPKGEAG
ncbi:ATP-binding cassette domain-containing protein [Paracoccus kondratievae]|uniref:iron ABC transporter ATP-binding protein n=1 Tax=Paracoccus kondratievae TaxID=135740 RepID=UPI00126654A5|nr:ATP-binding cassette domain-containing protein [Paracoccus kondratievae]QFQ88552.1 ATP-binding cassette domain-containing protein [Paracoccus kondratievae]